jgi:ADP-ribosyl-[dinitrogen reductase] hydrolase
MDDATRDRHRGALLGLAVGDAVGTTVEFRPPGTFEPVTDMVGGGPFNLEPGQWTDDTSMALCLAESLIEKKEPHPGDQMDRYLRWWRSGYLSSTGACFDIGNTIRAALEEYRKTGEWWAQSQDPMSAGNGSIMRLAPAPMAYAGFPRLAVEISARSSWTTHSLPVCSDACRYLGSLIVGAITGVGRDELLAPRFPPCPGYWEEFPLVDEIDEVAAGSFKVRNPPDIKGTGYVVRSLEAALWAFHRSTSFREGCLLAVNLGDDADTTAAVYGQIAGAFYGESGIPEEWRAKLAMREKIEELLDGLWARAQEWKQIHDQLFPPDKTSSNEHTSRAGGT